MMREPMLRDQMPSLRDCIFHEVEQYFSDLGTALPRDLYQQVMEEVERALLEKVLQRSGGQKGIAAQCLGINRNTLSKKIQRYGLDI
ncbi:helix-turn-helix domain-containing protein [Igneacidithiobacillus siniensis]|jgi:Fis family transcriptional regulator|uniref:helix-turn-helix domain-containing protein n=1 Tax=Acidithiobacillus TaxID=119977 RepID=UPI00200E3FE9|nr:helix-turn-helix domain-containing protein [Acidithiobacillus sp. S30A2]